MDVRLGVVAPTGVFVVGLVTTYALNSMVPLALSLAMANPAEIGREPALSKTDWKYFSLISKIPVSPNTAIYRFKLPHPEDVLGLPIGQHISVGVEVEGREVSRSYTPISSDDDKGYFDLLIKSYPTGNVSRVIGNMKIGEQIKVKGPKGNFNYKGPNFVRSFGMIAGGTGITPMLQIIKSILKNPSDFTEVSLLYANVNEDDILLREELDQLAALHPRFTVYYILNNAPTSWTGGVGFITKDMIQNRCPAPSSDIKILICGPPPMIKVMQQYTDELGYEKARVISQLHDMVFKF
ncbi:hypothetical protein SmJEL517_g03766 [Synchytrium microbalum]|uniref:NADH-cytochrome b5 reductase n=1 Tax=Synchytrium microbalum TaxID=1806994 RepID=A0A507C777_9FUNG|nr:uncharacterized protein SmJEL517_g03766 [Synchytrium microbalum]TPX33383.1 hypothetical protein SmJEL517_g03766 [Synchytrium microbalum]